MGSRSAHGSWRDRVLQLDRGGGRRRRPLEDRERGVALAARLDQPSAAGRDDLFDELVVAGQCGRHGVGVRLPSGGRPLDVGEQEGHSAGDSRKLLCHRHIQRSILCDDRGLESTKVRSGVDAQLVGQQRPRPLISAQRFALPAGAVQGEHQLAPSPLAQRRVGHRGLELADDLRCTARREQRIGPVLHQRGVALDPAGLLGHSSLGNREVRGFRARGSAPPRSGPPLGWCRRRQRRRGPFWRPACTVAASTSVPAQGPAGSLGHHDAVAEGATQRGDVGL